TAGQEVGEVIIRSPRCAGQYVAAPEQDAEKYHEGWLYIGDLATWDEHEYVTIVGRRDDMLLTGGEKVHPVGVEAALAEHPDVADARSEEHTSELQSRFDLVCRLLLEKINI